MLLDRRSHVSFLPRGVGRIIGWSLVSGGVALSGWFLRTMRDVDAPIRTDKPVSRLTTDGPFRYTRNPEYLSLAMIYAGIAVLRNALWAILLLPAVLFVIQREVIGREERYLERTFGEEYLDYKTTVRRWL
jgi:protein-S-isoprenylcysteine O-methyltransferase Ste14